MKSCIVITMSNASTKIQLKQKPQHLGDHMTEYTTKYKGNEAVSSKKKREFNSRDI